MDLKRNIQRNAQELDVLKHEWWRMSVRKGADAPSKETLDALEEGVSEKEKELQGRRNLLRATEARAAGKEYVPEKLPSPPKRRSVSPAKTRRAIQQQQSLAMKTRSGKWYQNLFFLNEE